MTDRSPAQIRADLLEKLEAEQLIPTPPPPTSRESAFRELLGVLAEVMS